METKMTGREKEKDDDEEGEEHDDVVDDESCNGSVKKFRVSRKSEEEKVAEAADRSLDASERLFKPWEPVFVVVQVCGFLCVSVKSLGFMFMPIFCCFCVDWFTAV